MNITSVHYRDYHLPAEVLAEILNSLSSPNDFLWPHESWMPMKLDKGLELESAGGHGPIGYLVQQYEYGKKVVFEFTHPKEFVGIHTFDITKLSDEKTRLTHTIDMQVNLKGYITWYIAVKWLHDALLRDCLDKVYNQHHNPPSISEHGPWVKILRKLLNSKN